MALTFPALLAAREQARRDCCRRHLGQVTLGVLRTLEGHGSFPANEPIAWSVAILPALDQTPLWARFDAGAPSTAPVNRAVLSTELAAFDCPSQPAYRHPENFATTNFAFNAALVNLRCQQVTDGMSHTAAVAELAESTDLVQAWGLGPVFETTWGQRTPHQGIHVGLADGSVHFLADTTRHDVHAALGTPRGGEIVVVPLE